MEIGSKLKNARTEQGLTQEQVAEELGVSRQSVSNWENGRTYPDIVSVIKMSDLYSLSLDELLKEDKKMMKHLRETTEVTEDSLRLKKRLAIAAYWGCWILAFLYVFILAMSVVKNEYLDSLTFISNNFIRYVPAALACIAVTIPFGVFHRFGKTRMLSRWMYIPITGIMFTLFNFAWYVCSKYLPIAERNFMLVRHPETWPDAYIRDYFNPYTGELPHFDFFQTLKDYIFTPGFAGNGTTATALPTLLLGCACAAAGIFIGVVIRNIIKLRKIERNENIEAPLGENAL